MLLLNLIQANKKSFILAAKGEEMNNLFPFRLPETRSLSSSLPLFCGAHYPQKGKSAPQKGGFLDSQAFSFCLNFCFEIFLTLCKGEEMNNLFPFFILACLMVML